MNSVNQNSTPPTPMGDPGSATPAKLDPLTMAPLAWATFAAAPGKNLMAGIVVTLASIALGAIPVLDLILVPLVFIGFARFALRSVRREDPPLADIFHGFTVWQGALKTFWHSLFVFFFAMKLAHPWLSHYAFVDASLERDGTSPVQYGISIGRDNGWRLAWLMGVGFIGFAVGCFLFFVPIVPVVIIWAFACAHAYEYLRGRAAASGRR